MHVCGVCGWSGSVYGCVWVCGERESGDDTSPPKTEKVNPMCMPEGQRDASITRQLPLPEAQVDRNDQEPQQ